MSLASLSLVRVFSRALVCVCYIERKERKWMVLHTFFIFFQPPTLQRRRKWALAGTPGAVVHVQDIKMGSIGCYNK